MVMADEAGTGPADKSDPATGLDFATFYQSTYAPAVRLGYVLTGRRDVAEEIVQEAFVTAHRRWDRISGYDSPAAWLRRVVVNRCTSVVRRRVTEARLVTRLGRERGVSFQEAEIDYNVWAAVRALPRRQAEVIALMFVEDRSVAEVAEILGCGESTVATHLRRGRLALAGALEGANPDEEEK